jgi:RNA polymerase sigma-70 factor (ECF subfamily)
VTSPDPRPDWFATTRWTVVLAAGRTPSPDASRALNELCTASWFPLYAYVRRRGRSHEDAQDLTQSFLASLTATRALQGLDSERGRFRAFLLASLKHFLANDHDRATAVKRGGGIAPLSLDWEAADAAFQVADPAAENPEAAFDREWALALLERVLQRLEDDETTRGEGETFRILKPFLTANADATLIDAAQQLGRDAGAVRVALHRLRKKYRALLREEISHTLSEPSRVDEELRALFAAVTR